MRSKNIILALVVAAILGAGGWALANRTPDTKGDAVPTAAPSATAEFTAHFADGVEGKAALETFKAQYAIETKEYPGMGEYVTSINGREAAADEFWAFYVNSAQATEGAGTYKAKAGDKLEFRIEKIQ
jgi:hypothetical protein